MRIVGNSPRRRLRIKQVEEHAGARRVNLVARDHRRLRAGIGGVVVFGELDADADLIEQVVGNLRVEIVAGVDADSPCRRVGDVGKAVELDDVVAAWCVDVVVVGVVGIDARKDGVAKHGVLDGDVVARGKHVARHIRIGAVESEAGRDGRVVRVDDQTIQADTNAARDVHNGGVCGTVIETRLRDTRNDDRRARIAACARIDAGLRAFDRDRFGDRQIGRGIAALDIGSRRDVNRVVRIGLCDRIRDR